MAESPEHLPEIRFKPVVTRYQAITNILAGLRPSEAVDGGFLDELHKELQKSKLTRLEPEATLSLGHQRSPLGELFSSFSGKPRTADCLSELAWRLAACYDELNAGREPALAFDKTKPRPKWQAIMIVSSCFLRLSKTQQPLLDVRFRILSGPFGGLCFNQLIPHYWFTGKLGRALGGGTRERRYPDHRELSGYWLLGKLDLSDPERTRLHDFRPVSAAVTHNRDLKKTRNQPCPLGFIHACYECWVGQVEALPLRFQGKTNQAKCTTDRKDANKSFDLLARPVHPYHFVTRRCTYCKADEALFEPSQHSRYCQTCQTQQIRLHRRGT
jgi:hypothetical protein